MQIFTPAEPRFYINNGALRDARLKLMLTQEQFAVKCGWSAAYQWKLENVIDEVNEFTKKQIEKLTL